MQSCGGWSELPEERLHPRPGCHSWVCHVPDGERWSLCHVQPGGIQSCGVQTGTITITLFPPPSSLLGLGSITHSPRHPRLMPWTGEEGQRDLPPERSTSREMQSCTGQSLRPSVMKRSFLQPGSDWEGLGDALTGTVLVMECDVSHSLLHSREAGHSQPSGKAWSG